MPQIFLCTDSFGFFRYKAEADATFPATDAGKEAAVEAAAVSGGFDFGAPTGALKVRDSTKAL